VTMRATMRLFRDLVALVVREEVVLESLIGLEVGRLGARRGDRFVVAVVVTCVLVAESGIGNWAVPGDMFVTAVFAVVGVDLVEDIAAVQDAEVGIAFATTHQMVLWD
jgi:hypothetical protein